MKLPAVAAVAVLLLAAGALAGCDEPKPRVVPPDPMALAPPTSPPRAPLSAGLARRPEMAGFSLDRIGVALDPANRQPAATPGDGPILLSGFGFDPVAKRPGKGVDVTIDGKAYGATYGAARQDVADYFKTPALVATGYAVTLPADALAEGPHAVAIRVIAADGKSYFQSPDIAFTVD